MLSALQTINLRCSGGCFLPHTSHLYCSNLLKYTPTVLLHIYRLMYNLVFLWQLPTKSTFTYIIVLKYAFSFILKCPNCPSKMLNAPFQSKGKTYRKENICIINVVTGFLVIKKLGIYVLCIIFLLCFLCIC